MTGLQNLAFAQLLTAARLRYDVRSNGGDVRDLAHARIALEDARTQMRAALARN